MRAATDVVPADTLAFAPVAAIAFGDLVVEDASSATVSSGSFAKLASADF
jgi:hypothetical protein